MSKSPKQLYEFGPFVLDPAERKLLRDGSPVPLQPKVLDTLLVLVENGGHLVEKDEFMRAVWPEEEFVEEQNLNKNISKLRRALGEGEGGAEYIETVPKSGYRFAAEVRAVDVGELSELVIETRTRKSLIFEETDDGHAASDFEARTQAPLPTRVASEAAAALPAGESVRRFGRWAAAATVTMAVALASAAYLVYQRGGGGEAITSVAVLPFTNDSGNPDVEYLSDGVSESLINSLSQLRELKVIARSSSFKYKGKEIDTREAARALGVQAIVSGRIARLGDELLVSVELVNAQDGRQLWGEQYKRRASDLLTVQADISREIADGLRLRLTSGERQQLARRKTANPQAYELLLKGQYYGHRGTPGDGKKAVAFYEQAVAADPSYAEAYAALALAYEGLVGGSVVDPKEYSPKAREAALKALKLDDSLAEAHLAIAFINRDSWKWEDSEREYRRAIELSPNLGGAHLGVATHLNCMGRHEEAIPEAMRARELSPLDLNINTLVGNQFTFAKRYDEAIETFRKTLELEPRFINAKSFLAYAYAAKGMYREAIAAHEEMVKAGDTSTSTQIYLGAAYVGAGEPEKAREILVRLETTKEYVSPAELAVLYSSLGEREKAFAALERAYSQHDLQLQYLKVEPGYDPLRADPRFQELMRRVGLPDARTDAQTGQ